MDIVFGVYTIALFAISGAICAYLGTRRGTFNSALRLCFFLVSGLVAFFITLPISSIIGTSLVGLLGDFFEEAQPIVDMLSQQKTLSKALGGIVAPLVFLPLFFVLDKLSFFAYVPLRKKFADNVQLHNIPHDKVYGAILGVVLAFCITLSCIMPIGGYPTLASQTVKDLTSSTITEELFPTETIEQVNTFSDAAFIKVDYAISGWLFNGLTSGTRKLIHTATDLITTAEQLTSAKTSEEVFEVLQQLPTESIALVASVLKDSVSSLIGDENSAISGLATLLLGGLETLPELQKELTEEDFNQELKLVSDLVTAVQNTDNAPPTEEMITSALSSQIVQNIVVNNADTVAKDVSELTSSMTVKEKKELKKNLEEFFNDNNASNELTEAVYKIFNLR